MEQLFTNLTKAVEGAPAIALAAAAIWGVLSIVLSPCHLSSIPLVIGFIDHQGPSTPRRACLVTTVFSVGILITIALVGIATAALGRMAGDVGAIGNYVVAGIFIAMGLYLLEVVSIPWSGPGLATQRQGLLAALLLGLVFGVAVGPCTFAYMAPLLGVVFKVASTRFAYAAGLLLTYGVGHCSVIVVAGTSAQLVQRFLNWNESSKGPRVLKMVCGALVILGGVYLIWRA